VDLLGICGGLIMDWTPDKYYLMKEWGINPYDPPDTLEGLSKMPQKEIKRLYNAIAENTGLPMVYNYQTTPYKMELMGVIYFHNNLYFENTIEGVSEFKDWVNKYKQTSRLLNWSPSNFVELMRKQGFFLAHMKYGVE
jgi:hypothetical protein